MNLPVVLTLLRVAAIPVVIGLVLLEDDLDHNFGIAAAVFTVAAVTDWIDGWLARRWNQTSIIGAFLDLTADKLLVTGTLAVLLVVDRVNIWLAASLPMIVSVSGLKANAVAAGLGPGPRDARDSPPLARSRRRILPSASADARRVPSWSNASAITASPSGPNDASSEPLAVSQS